MVLSVDPNTLRGRQIGFYSEKLCFLDTRTVSVSLSASILFYVIFYGQSNNSFLLFAYVLPGQVLRNNRIIQTFEIYKQI